MTALVLVAVFAALVLARWVATDQCEFARDMRGLFFVVLSVALVFSPLVARLVVHLCRR